MGCELYKRHCDGAGEVDGEVDGPPAAIPHTAAIVAGELVREAGGQRQHLGSIYETLFIKQTAGQT